jgi:hypothetical protein
MQQERQLSRHLLPEVVKKYSREVRKQASKKFKVQQEGQPSGHLLSGVIENQPNERIKRVREWDRWQSASKRDS